MSSETTLYEPFGAILKSGMDENGINRAELARRTGIAENSLVRYEKAGISKDGQYPTSPKLAKICSELNIDGSKALLSCLSEDEFWEQEGSITTIFNRMDHPYIKWLRAQIDTARQENALLRSGYQALVNHLEIDKRKLADDDRWLFETLLGIQEKHDEDEIEKLQNAVFYVEAYRDAAYPITHEEVGYRANYDEEHAKYISKLQSSWSEQERRNIRSMRKRTLADSFSKYCKHMPTSDLKVLIETFQKKIQERIEYANEWKNESSEIGLAASPSSQDDQL